MQYDMTQAELIEAVEFYLNEKVLKRPVKVKSVKERDGRLNAGALHVIVADDQEHIAEEYQDAARPKVA